MSDTYNFNIKMTDDLQNNMAVLSSVIDKNTEVGCNKDAVLRVILTAAVCSAIEDIKEELRELRLEIK